MGGGTGNSTLLRELKHQDIELTAIVNMADDGGSTGYYRKLGANAMGDLRQCLSAMSMDRAELAELFESRLEGHPLGNTALVVAENNKHSDINEAVEFIGKMLNIKGNVYPVTKDKPHLAMEVNGERYHGESDIGKLEFGDERPKVWLEPEGAALNPSAETAIYEANIKIIAPGNFYRSILPTMAVKGMAETLHYANTSDRPTILIANLLNEKGQTDGWHVMDYVYELRNKYKIEIDEVLYNTDLPDGELLHELGGPHVEPVGISQDKLDMMTVRSIGKPLLSKLVAAPPGQDTLFQGDRSKVRHDAAATASYIMDMLKKF